MTAPDDDLGDLMAQLGVADWRDRFADGSHDARVAANRQREMESGAELRRLMRMGVAVDLARHLVADELFLTKSLELVRRPNRKVIVVLSGRPGCGKTMAAAWALAHHEPGGRMIPAGTMCGYTPRRVRDRDDIEGLHTAPMLVIDDLGTEPINDEWRSVIDTAIDQRVTNERPTIITTNLRGIGSGSSFQNVYGPRIWSRLVGYGWFMESDDPDFRVAENRRSVQLSLGGA